MKVHSSINIREGEFIKHIINTYNSRKCLEVGMAFGISAMYILKNPNTTLISIDPFQSTQWKNTGVKLLKTIGYDKRHKLIEEKSFVALPMLLKDKNIFDLVFIDGWHTFDYTLIDFFYCDKMLKVGGIIIIDDAMHKGVSKFIKYLNANYKFYEKLQSPYTVGCYKKLNDDTRNWSYHKNF